MNYEFTVDWFTRSIDNFLTAKKELVGCKRILEIGSFEGRSSVWLVENILDDHGDLVCVDTWLGSQEHMTMDVEMPEVERRFDYNTNAVQTLFPTRQVIKRSMVSNRLLAMSILQDEQYDFIYIDGSHKAKDCLSDAVMAWHLLSKNGVMIFDDYNWDVVPGATQQPKIAIDSFVSCFADDLKMLFVNHQVGVKKL